MKPNTFLKMSLSLAAIFAQAACSTETAASAGTGAKATTTTSRSWFGSSTDTVILPEGTRLAVRTTSALSTGTQDTGQSFTANLEQPLLQDGREIAPKGADVKGTIVDADKGGKVQGVASMTVQLTGVQIGDQFVHISTNSVTRSAGTTKRKDAAEIGIGAGIGAAIGAIAGGGKGAAIGAAVGGGAGTGVVLATRGQAAVIPSESLLSFQLRAPLSVSVPAR